MAATKLNIFATSGSSGFLKCIVAKKGHSFVGSDISSLEPHVLAHFSQDPGLLKIYGKGRPENCVYLYLGSFSPVHGELIRSVYDRENPGSDALRKAKKVADETGLEVRKLYKLTVLLCNYQGGAFTLHQGMRKDGIDITLEECEQLVKLHRRTFSGIREFASALESQCRSLGGFIINGRGRPLAIPRDKRTPKDFLAYFCQSTGHDYLTRLLVHLNTYRQDHGLEKYIRPLLPDFHDATYWEVDDNYLQQARDMFAYAYATLNEELDLDVELKGDVKIGKDFTIK